MVSDSKKNAHNLSPIRMVIITAVSIFTAEAAAMFLISIINPQSQIVEALIDSTMLVILVSPALYLFLFRPLIVNMKAREKMEKKVSRLADIPKDNPDPMIEIDAETGLIGFCNDAGWASLGKNPGTAWENGTHECPVDWNHPLFEGLKPMIEELKRDGERKVLDVMEAEVGKPNTETYRVYSRKLRYVPKENLVRLYTGDITREQELIKTTRRLLHEVKEIRRKLEDEHKEAEQVGKSLLAPNPQDGGIIACVDVEPSSKAGGDRAGFITEKGENGKQKEWLVVLDASGHGKGAAKFQEVALGGLMATLALGRPMEEALKTANLTLEKLGTGRFLVGSIWRVMREKETENGWVYIEEFNIAQHQVIALDPEEDEPKEWQWTREEGSGSSLPMGLFGDGFNNIKPEIRKVKRDTRILTYTDGITEAMDADKE
ncbi:MAG: SpoIIE family protein phosphatase, partial [Nitrospinota bacterium]